MTDAPKKDNTKVELMLTSMGRSVEELRASEQWQAMLQVQAKFHRYSASNMLMIWSQCPDATQVAGYRQWQGLGRQVRKGERSIKIFAPMSKKDAETGETKLFGFKLVSVFDVGQTEGDPLPHIPWPEPGDVPEGLFDDLLVTAERLGLSVTVIEPEASTHGGARGWYLPDRKAITVVRAREATMCSTLLHEIGHAVDPLLHEDQTRAGRELVAESVAYVLGVPFGIPLEEEVTHYLASWQGTVDGLLAVMDRIRTAVDAVHAVVQPA